MAGTKALFFRIIHNSFDCSMHLHAAELAGIYQHALFFFIGGSHIFNF